MNEGHIDLFSGLGGFSIACQWNGITTEVFCEKDERCRAFLGRTYPGIPVLPDIREFDGSKWRGRFLLTAGVPCQPASRAGKQRGKSDDRWLWGEALRVVGEALPRWCLFENPPGIYDVGLDGILADLEGIGYEVGTVELPACAVNAPHRRARVWIVCKRMADAEYDGHVTTQGEFSRVEQSEGRSEESSNLLESKTTAIRGTGQGHMAHPQGRQDDLRGYGDVADQEGRREGGDSSLGCGCEGDLAHPRVSRTDTRSSSMRSWDGSACDSIKSGQGDMADTEYRNQGSTEIETQAEQNRYGEDGRMHDGGNWDSFVWVPCADGKFRRAPDDSFSLVDGLHRSVLAALGNSIVPQVAAEVIRAIKLAGV